MYLSEWKGTLDCKLHWYPHFFTRYLDSWLKNLILILDLLFHTFHLLILIITGMYINLMFIVLSLKIPFYLYIMQLHLSRLLCKYQHRVPSILVLNKIDILATKRRIFDLICKLTCNRLDDGRKSSVQINRHEPKVGLTL